MFFERPEAYAGEDQIVCDSSALLQASNVYGSYGQWLTDGDGSYFHYDGVINDTAPIDTVTVEVMSILQDDRDYYNYYWFVDAGNYVLQNFVCSDMDTVQIVFSFRPYYQFFHHDPMCFGSPASIWADTTNIYNINTLTYNYLWAFGTGAEQIPADLNNSGPHSVSWDSEAEADGVTLIHDGDLVMHLVSLQVTNQYGCFWTGQHDTITEPAPMQLDYVVTDAYLGDAVGVIYLANINPEYSIEWLTSSIVDPTDDSVTNLLPGIYLLEVTYEPEDQITYPLPLMCRDTVEFSIDSIGNGILEIELSGVLSIYPNPFTYETTIVFDNPLHENYTLVVTSLTGQIVYRKENIDDNKVVLRKGNLSSGYYTIELIGNKIYRGKVIVR